MARFEAYRESAGRINAEVETAWISNRNRASIDPNFLRSDFTWLFVAAEVSAVETDALVDHT
jgi:hypothetical protein